MANKAINKFVFAKKLNAVTEDFLYSYLIGAQDRITAIRSLIYSKLSEKPIIDKDIKILIEYQIKQYQMLEQYCLNFWHIGGGRTFRAIFIPIEPGVFAY